MIGTSIMKELRHFALIILPKYFLAGCKVKFAFYFCLTICVFLHEYSQFTGYIHSTTSIHFHLLHSRHLDISRVIAAESSLCAYLTAVLEPGTFGFLTQVANY